MKRVMIAAMIIAIGLVVGFGMIQSSSSSTAPNIKISDHYNGKKFINPTLEEPFSPGFKEIFRMMREGRPKWPETVENTGVPALKEDLKGDDLALTFVNHASFLIQAEGLAILTDPVWSDRVSPISWLGPKRIRKPGVLLDSLPNIDVIVISHNHYDHLDKETLKLLNDKFSPLVIVPAGDRDLVESVGFTNVREMDWWESADINSKTKITFAPSQHSSARGLLDRDESLWGSYFIQIGDRSVYFGGDGGYSTHFSDIQQKMGAPEFAILGIGAYAPKFFMKAIHLDPAEAVQAHLDLGAKQSFGMHFGTFQLASEGFEQPLEDLENAKSNHGLTDESFTVLLEGETRIFTQDVRRVLEETQDESMPATTIVNENQNQ